MSRASPSDQPGTDGTQPPLPHFVGRPWIEAYLENAPVGVIEWDAEYRVLRWEGAAEAIFGWAAAEVLGRSIADLNFVDPEDLAVTGEVMSKLASGSHPNVVARNRNRTRDGELRYCEWNNTVLLDDRGRLKSVLSFVVDRTAEWQAERRLALLARLSDQTRPLADPVEIVDVAMGLLREALGADRCAWAEVEADEDHFTFLGGAVAAGVPRAEGRFPVSAFGAEALRVMRAGRAFVCADALADLPAGADRDAYAATGIRALVATPILKRGRLVGGTGVHMLSPRAWTPEEVQLARDVTDRCWEHIVRARAVRDLRDREADLRVFVDSANEGILRVGPDDRIMSANQTCCRLLGYEHGETVGMRVLDFVFPEDMAAARSRRRERRETGRGERYEMRLRHKDGREVWVLNSTVAVHRDGRYDGTYSMIADITERRRAEGALRESEARFRNIADHSPLIVWVTDAGHRCTYLNARWYETTGQAPGTGLGFGWLEAVHPDDRGPAKDVFLAAAAERRSFRIEYRLLGADGAYRQHIDAAAPRLDDSGAFLGYVGSVLDISERSRMEAALRESESRERRRAQELAALLDSVPAAVWIASDAECRDVVGSRVSQEMLRLRPGANPSVTAEEVQRPTNFRVLRPDGTEYPPHELPLQVAARLGVPQRGARTVVAFEDGARTHLMGNAEPLLDDAGRPRGAVSAFIDITELVEAREAMQRHQEDLERQVSERTAELEQSQRRLRLSERMASLGTLSAGLGHDMGNILMPLRVRLETLERLVQGEEALAEVRGVRELADYLRKLASGLRQLAVDPRGSGGGTLESVELRSWWDETQGVYRNALPRGMTISFAPPAGGAGEGAGAGPIWARVPKAALTQAVFNLVQNAGDAMGPQGRGSVTVGVELVEAAELGGAGGAGVAIHVTDTGPGMSEEVRRRCMEPFFTTKARGISTGLGLALVYGLVREAGGSVEVRSEPGAGATFTLLLPAGQAPAPRAADRAARVAVGDARLRAYMCAELAQRGFRVELEGDAPVDVRFVEAGLGPAEGAAGEGVVAVPRGVGIAEARALIAAAIGGMKATSPTDPGRL